jgi:hypothetical protein
MALVAGGRARVRTRLGAEEEVHGASLDGGDLRRMPQRRVARGEEKVEEGERRDGACAPLQRVQNHALHAPDGRQVDHEVLGPLQHQSTIRHENAADFNLSSPKQIAQPNRHQQSKYREEDEGEVGNALHLGGEGEAADGEQTRRPRPLLVLHRNDRKGIRSDQSLAHITSKRVPSLAFLRAGLAW